MGSSGSEDIPGATPYWRDQEEIVISGISGRYPCSDNVDEFAENLLAGKDLVTEDDLRWPPGRILFKEFSPKLNKINSSWNFRPVRLAEKARKAERAEEIRRTIF